MKTIRFLIIATLLLFIAGCQKDLPAPANVTDEQTAIMPDGSSELDFRAKEYVTKPMKLWLEATIDPTQGTIGCIPFGAFPAGGWMQGHATHMGQIILQGSPWNHGTCYMVFDSNGDFVKGVIEGSYGQWTAANGDVLKWKGTYEAFPDGTFSADFNFDGGSGKFEGATGNAFGIGHNDPVTGNAVGVAEGWITIPK